MQVCRCARSRGLKCFTYRDVVVDGNGRQKERLIRVVPGVGNAVEPWMQGPGPIG